MVKKKEELIEDIKKKNTQNLAQLMSNVRNGNIQKIEEAKKKTFKEEKKRTKKTKRRYMYIDEEEIPRTNEEVLDGLEEDYRTLLEAEGLERRQVNIMFLVLGIIFLFSIVFLLSVVRYEIPTNLTIFLLDTFLIIFGMIVFLSPNTLQQVKERDMLEKNFRVEDVLEVRRGGLSKERKEYFNEEGVDDIDLKDIGGVSIKRILEGIAFGIVIFIGISSMMSLASMAMLGYEYLEPEGTVVSMSMSIPFSTEIFLNFTLVPFGESIFFHGVFPDRILFPLIHRTMVDKLRYNVSTTVIRGFSHIISNVVFALLHTFQLVVILGADLVMDSVLYIFCMGLILSALSMTYHVICAIEVHSFHNLKILFLNFVFMG